MGAAAIPIAVAATAVTAFSKIKEGAAVRDANNANAAILREKAASERDAAAVDAYQIAQDNTRKQGQIVSAYAAGGVDVGSGSPLQVMADAALQGELTRQLRLYQGELNARTATAQAKIETAQGSAAMTAGYLGAGSTVLTGGMNIYNKYGQG